jgi:hypothetical protein
VKTRAGLLLLASLVACGGGSKTASGGAGSTASGGSKSSSATAPAGFCEKVTAYDTQFKSTSPSGGDIIRVYTDLLSSAPDEIKSDLETLRDYASTQSAESDQSGSDQSSSEAALAAAETASTNFATFVKNACGLDLESDASTSKFSSIASSIN